MTFTGAVNCNIDYNAIKKEEDAGMCTVFEETRLEGVREGLIEGQARYVWKTDQFKIDKLDIYISKW